MRTRLRRCAKAATVAVATTFCALAAGSCSSEPDSPFIFDDVTATPNSPAAAERLSDVTRFFDGPFDVTYDLVASSDASPSLTGTIRISTSPAKHDFVVSVEVDGKPLEIRIANDDETTEVCVRVSGSEECRSRGWFHDLPAADALSFSGLDVKNAATRAFDGENADCYEVVIPRDRRVAWLECYASDGRLAYLDEFGAQLILGVSEHRVEDIGMSLPFPLPLGSLQELRIRS